jgi:tetratricopeptide (TPR) repeat protein
VFSIIRGVPPRILVFLLSVAVAAGAGASAQPDWIQSWLADYAGGRHADVAAKLRSVGDLKAFESDLDKAAPKWLGGTHGTAESRRRALAAFALESASAQLERGSAATKILEWGCRQIRRHPKPDEFDRLWHLAAFALFAGAVDPDGLEAHVVHAKFQFPNEPWLPFERAVASELRTFPRIVAESRIPAATVTKSLEEAVKRYTEAARNDATRAEAFLRRGRIELALGRADQAIESLDRVNPTDDPNVQYLGHLFRGQALERLNRTDDARQAYEAALAVRPETQSASMALAALLFRRGERDLADRRVRALFDRQKRTDDPWWLYWPADYRHLDGRLTAMRSAVTSDESKGVR